jgi:hypothetical protein
MWGFSQATTYLSRPGASALKAARDAAFEMRGHDDLAPDRRRTTDDP